MADLTQNPALRLRLSTGQSFFLVIGFMLGGFAGKAVERYGYEWMAFFYAGLGMLAFFLPAWLAWKPSPAIPKPASRPTFWPSLKTAAQDRSFVFFSVTWACFMVASYSSQVFAPYLVTEVCGLRQGGAVYFYLPAVATTLLCYPCVAWLAERYGKRKIYAASLCLGAIVFPGTLILGQGAGIPIEMQCTAWGMLQAAALSGAMALSGAIIAELADRQSSASNEPQSGMYFAIVKVFEQGFTGVVSFLLPLLLLLGRSRSDPLGPLGIRMTGLVGGFFLLCAYFCFRRVDA
jgi:Na+/melibiose symporter-like transporter